MKKLSETLTELGIAFSLPIQINDTNGNETYWEDSDGFWWKSEYDTNGNKTYYEDSNSYWWKSEYDTNGNKTYYEDATLWCKTEYDSNGNETYWESGDSNGDLVE
jgi:hypothetical protein